MTQFGVCGDPKMGLLAKEAGYDYFEWSVGSYLHPREEEAIFLSALEQVQAVGLPCPVVNVFIPADLKITGPTVDPEALESFVQTALRRAEIARVDTIVFGSGGARRVPDGFSREKAWDQLVSFGRMAGKAAAKHGITIAVEPLNLAECNILNTVGESAFYVQSVDHPNVRLLVDGYHWAKDHDTKEGILNNASLLAHAHIAAVDGRLPPNDDDPCGSFLDTIRRAGYAGRISIEGMVANPVAELPKALQIMKAHLIQ